MNVDYPEFVVKRDIICDVADFLYKDEELAFQYLTTMATIHYPDNAGQEFAVMYQLHNLPKNLRIRVKIFFPISDAVVPTMSDLFPTANVRVSFANLYLILYINRNAFAGFV